MKSQPKIVSSIFAKAAVMEYVLRPILINISLYPQHSIRVPLAATSDSLGLTTSFGPAATAVMAEPESTRQNWSSCHGDEGACQDLCVPETTVRQLGMALFPEQLENPTSPSESRTRYQLL